MFDRRRLLGSWFLRPFVFARFRCSLLAESDARYGGFDFRAAHEEADADLQELLDNNESLVSWWALCPEILERERDRARTKFSLTSSRSLFRPPSPSGAEDTSATGC